MTQNQQQQQPQQQQEEEEILLAKESIEICQKIISTSADDVLTKYAKDCAVKAQSLIDQKKV